MQQEDQQTVFQLLEIIGGQQYDQSSQSQARQLLKVSS